MVYITRKRAYGEFPGARFFEVSAFSDTYNKFR